METTLNTRDAALAIRSAMRNLREQKINAEEYRVALAYVRARTSEADYNLAKVQAIAADSR